jgi:hypothetical protein
MFCNWVERPNRSIVPIRYRHDTEVYIIVGGSRSLKDDCAHDSISILTGEMRVVPTRAELGDPEFVLARLAGSNRTFRHPRHSVILVGKILSDTVEVNACAVVLQAVLNIHNHRVTPFGPNSRSWILAVNKLHLPGTTTSIRLGPCDICDLEIVLQVVSSDSINGVLAPYCHCFAVWRYFGVKIGRNAEAVAPAATR